MDNHYTYDHNGDRTEKQQLGGSTRYTYDGLNQLTKVEYPGYTEELYYDRAGNRRRRVSGGVEESYQYDPANHLTEYTKGGVKTTFTYDKAGNLIADDRARYTYDLFNRTEKVETFDGHIQINRYDAEGLRHEMEEDGKLVQFIFRGQEVVMEETEDNKIRHIRGYELIASDAERARTYYHYASDEIGSITHVVTGKDKEGKEEPGQNQETASTGNTTGNILNRYEYDAWGNLVLCEEMVENRFKFNGQQYDPISQQYYLRARYYNPVIARFTQEDTYRGDGLNLYAYCRNNSVYYVDPSGHSCDKDATQRRPEGSDSFADQLAQHVADEVAFNQEHGLTTQYDTPQAEAANRRVEQGQQLDNFANRPNGPIADVPNSRDRASDASGRETDFYVTPSGDVIPAGTCLAIGLPGEPSNLRTASQLQMDADRIHAAIVTSSGQPDTKAQANRTTTVTQGYDSDGNVVHTITSSTGVVTGTQKEAARSIYGDDVVIPTRSQVPQSSNTNSHHGEQQGISVTDGQSGRVQASSSGARHGGAACGPCSIAQADAGVVNVTGVQEKAGGNGRIFPK